MRLLLLRLLFVSVRAAGPFTNKICLNWRLFSLYKFLNCVGGPPGHRNWDALWHDMARNSSSLERESTVLPATIWYILVVAQVLKTYIATVRSDEFCVSLVMALGSRLDAFLQAQKCRLLGNALLPALTCGWRFRKFCRFLFFFCLWWPWHVQIGDFKILILVVDTQGNNLHHQMWIQNHNKKSMFQHHMASRAAPS